MTLEFIGMMSAIMMMLCYPICIYAIYAKLEEAEEYLKFSTFIVTVKYRFKFGLFGGKLKRLFVIAIVILMPHVFQWRRLVLAEDVKCMPGRLKLWIVIPFLLIVSSFAGMALSWLLAQ
ncbi:hypothetical protein [Pseudomonas rhodesiae]|uniref:hypothetical protein n=1 Tax=Pseudomonas rhodesiae TaxID=76760 RepID=UPI000B8C6895|nr:hypothetical protein [Pseudomonas rhodesiae]OXS22351.1 hypothetical protein CGU36_09370 [Pseudomonas fluorescens]OZO49315.1 hypothetical protein CGU37_08415 [Pseudomonas fluorescens]TGY17874.1 hypothetical protein E5845_13965 [Pseudomonas fluorescens]WLG40117.1 hypothetical protein PSH93_02885 [Pseudomonas rhodesiae]WLI30073.1 hypothetical protein PSH61_02885 [Pseudomonas rhodesiae]